MHHARICFQIITSKKNSEEKERGTEGGCSRSSHVSYSTKGSKKTKLAIQKWPVNGRKGQASNTSNAMAFPWIHVLFSLSFLIRAVMQSF
jgi:hypothetical protein